MHLVADRLDDLAHSGQPATHPLGQRGRGGAQVPLCIAVEGAFTGKAGPPPKEAQAGSPHSGWRPTDQGASPGSDGTDRTRQP